MVASAGTVYYLTLEQIKNAIREAGYIPRQRNVFYEYIDGDSVGVVGDKCSARTKSLPLLTAEH